MYSSALFAILGVVALLGTYRLFGYGAAVLSQVALLVARKIWLAIRTPRSN